VPGHVAVDPDDAVAPHGGYERDASHGMRVFTGARGHATLAPDARGATLGSYGDRRPDGRVCLVADELEVLEVELVEVLPGGDGHRGQGIRLALQLEPR